MSNSDLSKCAHTLIHKHNTKTRTSEQKVNSQSDVTREKGIPIVKRLSNVLLIILHTYIHTYLFQRFQHFSNTPQKRYCFNAANIKRAAGLMSNFLPIPVMDKAEDAGLLQVFGKTVNQKIMICISRVPDQNGIFQACYMVEIYHSGLEPSICSRC